MLGSGSNVSCEHVLDDGDMSPRLGVKRSGLPAAAIWALRARCRAWLPRPAARLAHVGAALQPVVSGCWGCGGDARALSGDHDGPLPVVHQCRAQLATHPYVAGFGWRSAESRATVRAAQSPCSWRNRCQAWGPLPRRQASPREAEIPSVAIAQVSAARRLSHSRSKKLSPSSCRGLAHNALAIIATSR